jgi:arylsulfatase A-like enzyme
MLMPKKMISCTLAACAALFCALPAPGGCAPAAPAGYNIILVVVDCLRADHLSLYGYGRKTSPNIDAFAGDAAVFRQAVAQAPTTLLSFASIFTSQEVSAHGVTGGTRALGDSPLTLAAIFRIYNYKTAAFVGGLNLNPLYRLDRGFDKYSYVGRTDSSFRDTIPAALAWAAEREAKGEKFLMVVHGNDLHTPYVFPASGLFDKGFKVSGPLKALAEEDSRVFAAYKRKVRPGKGPAFTLTDDDAAHLVARYDEGISYSDGLLGGFLQKLRESGTLARTVVFITGDHGEGLFDHDYYFHDFNLYDDTLHVPLIIKAPGAGAREITGQVRLIDLMPTMLDFAGIPPDADAQGRSLKPLVTVEGDAPGEEYAFSESSLGGKVIRSAKWKLIRARRRTELYDLQKDPGEKHDLAGAEKAVAADLEKKLAARLASDAAVSSGEALPAGGKFAADMKRDEAWREKIYGEMGKKSGR